MTYLADESSTQDARPRDLYVISVNDIVRWRHTSASRDIVYDGQTYKAISMERGSIKLSENDENEVALTLPVDHDLVRLWTRQGVPPQRVMVTVTTLMLNSGAVRRIWGGKITSLSCRGSTAEFLIPSRMIEALKKRLPTVSVSRACHHVLYASGTCRASRDGSSPAGVPFKCVTTTMVVNGRSVRLDLSNVPAANAFRANWLVGGDLFHPASGERMTIVEQADANPGISTVTTVMLALTVPDLKTGDTVHVFAGCDRTVATCRDKFANQVNYGGQPYLRFDRKPWWLGDFGTVVED